MQYKRVFRNWKKNWKKKRLQTKKKDVYRYYYADQIHLFGWCAPPPIEKRQQQQISFKEMGKKPNLMCANSSSRWIREVIRKIFIVARYLFLFEIIHLPISRHRRRCWCLNCEHIACTFEHDIIHCLTNGDRCKKNMLTSLKWAHCQLVKKSHEIQTTMVVDLCTYLLLDCWLIFAHAGCDNNISTPCKK